MGSKTIHIRYFSLLGEKRGSQQETLKTEARNAEELFAELRRKQGMTFTTHIVKVAINNQFAEWHTPLQEGDTVAFLPPFSGG